MPIKDDQTPFSNGNQDTIYAGISLQQSAINHSDTLKNTLLYSTSTTNSIAINVENK